MKKTIRKRILSAAVALGMTTANFIVPVAERVKFSSDNTITAFAAEETIRIEARIIFGDYKDHDSSYPGGNRYEGLTPTITLKQKNGNDSYEDSQNATSTVVSGTDPARKDWCYQYSCYWDVPKLDTGSYYVNLDSVEGSYDYMLEKMTDPKDETKQIWNEEKDDNGNYIHTLSRSVDLANYDVYYLRDNIFEGASHTGDKTGADNTTRKIYQSNAGRIDTNTDEVIYIFLDPKVPINNRGNVQTEGKVHITFKKRWDGYNEQQTNGTKYSGSDADIHPNENIVVQLQRWNETDKKWEKFTDEVALALDDPYTYKTNWEYVDESGTHYFTNKNAEGLLSADVPEADRYKIGGKDYKTSDGLYINNTIAIANKIPTKDSGGIRLELEFTDDIYWNDIVLTPDGANHPQHFELGYYYDWKELPEGEYRVIETMTFFDVDGDDVYTEGTDKDVTDEYYYMVFPPSRSYNGICHAQNFTKYMNLSVEKDWYVKDKNGESLIIPDSEFTAGNSLFNSTVNYDIYRGTVNGTPEKNGDTYKVGEQTLEKIKDNEQVAADAVNNYEKLDTFNGQGEKYYYYIREYINDSFTSLNVGTTDDGFIKAGASGTYGVSYEDGDFRNIVLKNQPQMKINVEKKWIGSVTVGETMKLAVTPGDYSETYQNKTTSEHAFNSQEPGVVDNTVYFNAHGEPSFVIANLDNSYYIDSVKYWGALDGIKYRGDRIVGMQVQGSNNAEDENSWVTLATVTAMPEPNEHAELVINNSENAYKYVRFYNTKECEELNIGGIEIYGHTVTEASVPDEEVGFVLLSSKTDLGNNPAIVNEGNTYKAGDAVLDVVGDYTTENLTKKIDVSGFAYTADNPATTTVDETNVEKLYYYIYETSNHDGYTASIPTNGISWVKGELNNDYKVTIANTKDTPQRKLTVNVEWLTKEPHEGNITVKFKDSSGQTVSEKVISVNELYQIDAIEGETYTVEVTSSEGEKYYISKSSDGDSYDIKVQDNLIDVKIEKQWETLDGNAPTDDRTVEVKLWSCKAQNDTTFENWKDLTDEEKANNPLTTLLPVLDESGNQLSKTITNNGTATFKVPYLDENGYRYLYTAEEVADSIASKYTIEYDMGQVPKTNSGNIVIVNSLKKGKLQIEKNWLTDNPDRYSNLEVTVKILANGETLNISTTDNPVVLNSSNGWKSAVIEVPKYSGNGNNEPVKYTIEEISVTGENVSNFTLAELPYEFTYNDAWGAINGGGTVGDNTLKLRANNIEEGYELPSTGGIGTKWFTIIGGGMFTIAFVYLISKRRLSRKVFET